MAKEKKKDKTFENVASFLIALVVVSYLFFGHGKIPKFHFPKLPVAAAAQPISSNIGCARLERLWDRAGGPVSQRFMAAEVAMAESGGNPGPSDVDMDSNGTEDRGLWQINSVHDSSSNLFIPIDNAREAVYLYKHQGWYIWVTVQKGAEVGQCPS
jgi:hypothetical protein